LPIFAVSNRIAISDFAVHSDNPRYKYMGKGISEMISVELRKSHDVDLIEREKRAEILEEMEISLSDLADTEIQIEVGKMLIANYIVFGEIVDMDKKVLISLRMIDVESGKVVWNEKLMEKLSKYDLISGYFASSILNFLDVQVSKTTVAKIEKKEEKSEEVVIAFSTAVDHYDKKEIEQAKKELKRAKKIDPKSEAVRIYIVKLESISPKCRVELEKYIPAYNPASLSFIQNDKLFFWGSSTAFKEWGSENIPDLGDGFSGYESGGTWNIGYMFPLAERFGMAVEYIGSTLTQKLETPAIWPDPNFFGPKAVNMGGCVSIACRITDRFALGVSGFVYRTGETYEELQDDPTYYDVYGSVDFGIVGFLFNDAVILDVQVIYTTQEQRYFDREKLEIIEGQRYPLIIDNTITTAFLDNRLFVSLKGIEELYFDSRGGHALRVIPIVEYFFWYFLSVRAGYEYAHINQLGKFSNGHGFLFGIGGKIRNFELFFNYSYRNKILRILPGYTLPEQNILMGLIYNVNRIKR